MLSSLSRSERAGLLVVVAILVLFVGHRVAVIYSAGDFLWALEPSEAKHTQIAWDLRSGRFGTEGFGLDGYVANSGSVHHGSYLSCALAFAAVSLVAGFDMVAVRLTPLLFWIAGFVVLVGAMFRRFGPAAAVMTALGLTLVPSQVIGVQLALLGSHSETVLPVAALLAVWAAWLDRDRKPTVLTALLGVCMGYAAAFSYLLIPIVAMVVFITLLPPLPRLDRRTWAAGVGGVLVGLWPTWLIIALEPGALFTHSVTERTETTPLALAAGGGAGWAEIRQTLAVNLPEGAYDYWVSQATLPALFGGQWFEQWAWRVVVLGPLLLLPLALSERGALQRKVALLLSVGPALSYLFLCVTTPWKPHVPLRYMIPMLVLAAAAPGVAVALGLRRRDGLGRGLALLAILSTLWMAGPRLWEAGALVRPSRWANNSEHRLVTYYNLGVHTVWAEDVPAVNDLVDVRSHSGDPRSFGGIQAALWGAGATHGLGRGSWEPVESMDWPSLRASMGEWQERQSYFPPAEQDDPLAAAQNIGWGVGIRTRWDPAVLAEILAEAGADWPDSVSADAVWEGFGLGWGRIDASASSEARLIPEDARGAVQRGIEAGRALGEVPEAPIPPIFATVRGTAT